MKQRVLFSVSCIYLKRTVVLYKNTWYGKISEEHHEAKGCLEFIKQILSTEGKDILIYQKQRDKNSIAVFKKSPNLKPYYDYIKITLKILNDKEAVITSCYGQNNIPGLDMEVYDGH